MPRSRSPDIRRVRTSTTYSVLEIARLLDVHENTVRRWLRSGLNPMDASRPVLIHGAEMKRFLLERRISRKQKCAPDELYCLRCRAPRKPKAASVVVASHNQKTIRLRGQCGVCEASIWRAGSLSRLIEYADLFGFSVKENLRLKGLGFPILDGDLKKD